MSHDSAHLAQVEASLDLALSEKVDCPGSGMVVVVLNNYLPENRQQGGAEYAGNAHRSQSATTASTYPRSQVGEEQYHAPGQGEVNYRMDGYQDRGYQDRGYQERGGQTPNGARPGMHSDVKPEQAGTEAEAEEAVSREEIAKAEFSDVSAAAAALRAAAEQVMASDREQIESVLSMIGKLFPSLLTLLQPQLQAAEEPLVANVNQLLSDIDELVKQRIAPHAEVPARLEAERDAIRKEGEVIGSLVDRVKELTTSKGWAGAAAEGYGRAAVVQASALEELSGFETSSANAMDRAALLNRCAFFYAAEAMNFTAKQLAAMPPGNSTQLYSRTKRVDGYLHALYSKLTAELDAIGVGNIGEQLAADLARLLEAPAILPPAGWPTGGGAAEIRPAPTALVIPELE